MCRHISAEAIKVDDRVVLKFGVYDNGDLTDSHTETRKIHGIGEDDGSARHGLHTPLEFPLINPPDTSGVEVIFDAGKPGWWSDEMTEQATAQFAAEAHRRWSGAMVYRGNLDLSGVTAIPAGFAPTVDGSLYLSGVTAIPAGFAPTVGGGLDLSGVTAIPAGFAPTVGGRLNLSGVTAIPAGFAPKVGGDLDLSGATAIPTGFKPKCREYFALGKWTSGSK